MSITTFRSVSPCSKCSYILGVMTCDSEPVQVIITSNPCEKDFNSFNPNPVPFKSFARASAFEVVRLKTVKFLKPCFLKKRLMLVFVVPAPIIRIRASIGMFISRNLWYANETTDTGFVAMLVSVYTFLAVSIV